MRALLVVNPKASSALAGTAVLRRLHSELSLDVVRTAYRGHAVHAASTAAARGYDAVIACGGDGTVHEVVNGLLRHTGNGAASGRVLPLGLIPAGGANVFARALGVPRRAPTAAEHLIEAVRSGRRRQVNLASAAGRWFVFSAGLGLDAEVVRAVEARRSGGRRGTPSLYVSTAVEQYLRYDRRAPAFRVTTSGGTESQPLFLVIVSNSDPWTYLGSVPIRPTRAASFDTALDVVGLRSMAAPRVVRALLWAVLPAASSPVSTVLIESDVETIHVRSAEPRALQLDGEYIGEFADVTFRTRRGALSVLV